MIQFDKVTLEELKNRLCENQNFQAKDIDNTFLDFICKSIKSQNNHEFFEYVIDETTLSQREAIDLILPFSPRIYFKVNLELATWTLIGTILDLFITKGLSLTILSSVGLSGQFLTRISLQNGELCNILKIKDQKARSIKQLSKFLINQICYHPNFECKYNRNNLCKIDNNAIRKNVELMIEKGILVEENSLLKIRRY